MGVNMGHETGNLRQCKKCLLRDMAGQDAYFESLWEYINNMDMDIKAPASLYEDRLLVCRECDFLLEGMCRICGCYVELRAVVTKNNCPKGKW